MPAVEECRSLCKYKLQMVKHIFFILVSWISLIIHFCSLCFSITKRTLNMFRILVVLFIDLFTCLFILFQPEEEADPAERDNFLQQLYKFMEDRGNVQPNVKPFVTEVTRLSLVNEQEEICFVCTVSRSHITIKLVWVVSLALPRKNPSLTIHDSVSNVYI